MKTYILALIAFFCCAQFISAQDSMSQKLKLNSTDTIPDFGNTINKLKISGTIYESDGVTPAKGVILYIEQADENGDFELRKLNDEKYVYHSGAIKTDADGRYTFYTFVPGNDRRYNQLQQLFPVLKQPAKPEYIVPSFLFDGDPLLTKKCRKRMAKKDDLTRILKPVKQGSLLVVEKDIIIQEPKESMK
ncbi:MAG: hypothetical protein KJO25_02895 [Bacteroidia bacterium]|nr:hypothetical protein [Bacteroidia bacterium]